MSFMNKKEGKLWLIIAGLALLSVLTVLTATGLGPVAVSPGKVAKILLQHIPGIGSYISVELLLPKDRSGF